MFSSSSSPRSRRLAPRRKRAATPTLGVTAFVALCIYSLTFNIKLHKEADNVSLRSESDATVPVQTSNATITITSENASKQQQHSLELEDEGSNQSNKLDLSHLPPLSKVPSEKKIPYSTCSDSDNGSNNNSIPIPHVEELRDAHLCRSLGHQRKFFSVRDSVLSWIKTHKEQRHLLRGTGKGGRLFAFIVNKDYAFRHIFKSGGTTIQKQTHKGVSGHVPQWKVGNRHLFATSGWAECGKRNFDDMMNLSSSSDGYDERVQAWLKYVRAPSSSSRGLKRCIPHSLPQANFLYDTNFQWDEKLDLVGDLKEISGLLELIGFRYNASIASGNVARDNEIKTRHFPRNKSLLSNTTIQDICSYVALDYYLFDFDPPIPCREALTANMADIMNITFK
ncbi:hypothetical protein ACHAWC_002721 [Mediolabrus comicus]